MGNLFLLEKYEDLDIRIIDNFTEIFIMKNNKVVIEDRRDYILSIIPINKKIRIEKLKGVKYPLDKKDVKRGSTLCISNIINQRECLISISEGKAFIIITNNMEDINGSN
jgi:thiamine pyrophosphokinase